MYLTEIEVTNWRGIAHQQIQLTPGLNIIHGPNESGKSTLRQAIRAAFLQNPGSKSKDALALRPWASTSNPRVRVDFQLDGDLWSLQKTFLSSTGSKLIRGGKLLASDRKVHEHLSEVLSQAVWMGHLWSEQGDMGVVEVPRSLRGKLVAEEVVSPGVLWLEDKLSQDLARFWTPTGRPKKELQTARDAAFNAEEKADEAQEELRRSEEISEGVASLRHELELATAAEKDLVEQLAGMQERVGAWDRHRATLAQWNVKAQASQQEADFLERWERTSAQVIARWDERDQQRAKLKALQSQMGAEPSRDSIDALTALVTYLKRLEQKKIAEKLSKLGAPSTSQLTRLRKLDNEISRAEAKLEAAAMTLTLTALTDLRPEVRTDGVDQPEAPLGAGLSASWLAHRQARLILPGVAELSLQGGASDSAALLEKRDEWSAERQQILEELGCPDTENAQARADQARTLEALLQGKPPNDAELAKLAGAVADITPYEAWDDDRIRQEMLSLNSDLGEQEASWNQARAAHQKFRTEHEALLRSDRQAVLEQSYAQLMGEAAQWPVPEEKPELPSLAKLSATWLKSLRNGDQAASLRVRWDQQQAELRKERIAIKAPAGEEVTPAAIEAAKQQRQARSQQRERLLNSLNQDLGRLRERSDQYQTLVKARESHAALLQESRKAELEAAASQLLMKTFEEARGQLQSDLVGPLQERVAGRLSRITAGRYRGLQLDETLSPSTVTPQGVESAELTDLSFGTREQLLFVTRLCLAEMLSEKHSRQSLLFDDNLVHTDEARMALAIEMLAESAQTSQIVILTCHPERYQKLSQANRVAVTGHSG